MRIQSLALAPEVLAAKLLARALHDIAGAAAGLTAAVDLLGETTSDTLRREALDLARESVSEISGRIAFYRAAFGGGDAVAEDAVAPLARSLFAGSRARLEITPLPPGAPAKIGQATLILAQISAAALIAGGVAQARVEDFGGAWGVRVNGEGERTKLYPETRAGLSGADLASGLSSRWAPARYLRALTDSAGGLLTFDVQEGWFWIDVTLPEPAASGAV